MCRNIKRLFYQDSHITDEDIWATALQFVRKITGMRKPSKVNAAVFERGVEEITDVSKNLLNVLVSRSDH